jgi:hypothetical protein
MRDHSWHFPSREARRYLSRRQEWMSAKPSLAVVDADLAKFSRSPHCSIFVLGNFAALEFCQRDIFERAQSAIFDL